MSKLDQVLRSEISRLSRKEIKQGLNPLLDNIKDVKKTLKELSKRIDGLEKQISQQARTPASQQPKQAAEEQPARPSGVQRRLSPGLIKKLRKRLKISQEDLATLVGVSQAAVASWEQARAKPRDRVRDEIVQLRDMKPQDVYDRLNQLKQPVEASEAAPADED